MGLNVGPAGISMGDLSPEDMADNMLKSEGIKERQPENVLTDMKGWFEWFDALHMEVAWFEIPRRDMSLLMIFPAYCQLPTHDPNHLVARYHDILLVSEPTTEAIVGHPIGDQM